MKMYMNYRKKGKETIEIMERKIGEIFNYQDNWYQCIKSITCTNCGFNNKGCLADKHITGDCSGRLDGASVIFRKLEKFGEPTMLDSKLVQKILKTNRYSCNGCCFESPECDKADNDLCCEYEIYVEIKQNKEDMKEKKLNLKEFNLEAAKAGKPVCTRDGRKARIICFDRKLLFKGISYPIIALVEDTAKEETVYGYNEKGKVMIEDDATYKDDLMMLPQKKEGWVNIYNSNRPHTSKENCYIMTGVSVFKTKESAISYKDKDKEYIDTIKIEWEE